MIAPIFSWLWLPQWWIKVFYSPKGQIEVLRLHFQATAFLRLSNCRESLPLYNYRSLWVKKWNLIEGLHFFMFRVIFREMLMIMLSVIKIEKGNIMFKEPFRISASTNVITKYRFYFYIFRKSTLLRKSYMYYCTIYYSYNIHELYVFEKTQSCWRRWTIRLLDLLKNNRFSMWSISLLSIKSIGSIRS